VGKNELRVLLPMGIWDREAKPSSKELPGKLVQSITATDNGVEILTRTDAFGYIRVPSPGKPEFVLQLFRDPIGARWESASTPAPAEPAPRPEPRPAAKPPAPQRAPAPQPAPEQATPESQPAATAADVAQTLDAVRPDQPRAAVPEGDLPPEGAGERKPFFAVPYSVRNEVQAPDVPQAEPAPGPQAPDAPQAPDTQAPDAQAPDAQAPDMLASAPEAPSGAETGDYPPASELRFKAVNKTAEDVKFAELAGDAGTPARDPAPGRGVGPGAGGRCCGPASG
jgi:hypothetical protein